MIVHGFAYKCNFFKKIGSIFQKIYTQFRIIKNGYSVKLIFFDLHTLMKIIQIFICHSRMYVT